MKVGDLVSPKEGVVPVASDYGVGLIVKEIIDSSLWTRRVPCYVVQWWHEHQWWEEDELVLLASLDELVQ